MTSDPRDDALRSELEQAASQDGGEAAGVDDLLQAARTLRASAASTGREAAAAENVARARFDRFLREHAAPSPAPVRRSWWTIPGSRVRVAAGSIAAAAAILVLAVFLLPSLSGDVETAAAQVLEPGDVVQVEGVVREVSENPTGDVVVASDFGDVAAQLGDGSVVLDDGSPADASSLRPGDLVVVSGLVDSDRRLQIASIAIGAREQRPPDERPLDRLDRLDQALEARVVALAMAGDGETVRIVLASGERRLLAEAPAGDVTALFDGGSLGRDVHLRPPTPGTGHGFEIELRAPGPPPSGGIVGVRGVVLAAGDGVLAVATLDGRVNVRVLESTTIRFGVSGLDSASFGDGHGAVGHTVGATGRIDPATGDVLADVVLLGRAPLRERR